MFRGKGDPSDCHNYLECPQWSGPIGRSRWVSQKTSRPMAVPRESVDNFHLWVKGPGDVETASWGLCGGHVADAEVSREAGLRNVDQCP